jgi:hypothetical protein
MLHFLQFWSAWAVTGCLLISGLGILVGLACVLAMSPDHFIRPSGRPAGRHPALHAVWVVIRNLLGAMLTSAGIAMLVLPGQGLLTIILGLSLMDFPGKHRLLHAALERPAVRLSLNWMRRQAGRPALQFPAAPAGTIAGNRSEKDEGDTGCPAEQTRRKDLAG